MSNVKVNGTTYNNVSSVKLPLAAGGGFATYAEANYQEKTVTANGVVTPDSGYSALSKVTVNVPTSGSIKEASGTITLTENQAGIKVTGLTFTPKAFVLKWVGTPPINCTAGGFYVRGFSGIYRTGSGSSSISGSIGNTYSESDFEPLDDTYEPAYGANCKILQHGFAVGAYNSSFPFRSGTSLSWYAVG